jgi:hypothetical protein
MAACGVLVLLIGLSAGSLLSRRFVPAGANQPNIPDSPPDEGNRVEHPSGFSIICPVGWHARTVTMPEDAIIFKSKDLPWRSGFGAIVVTKLAVPPVLDGAHTVPFKKDVAHARESRESASGPEGFSKYSYIVYISDPEWYSIEFLIYEEVERCPDIARKYLETFSSGNSPLP